MNQYEVIQTLSDNQFICLKISDNELPSSLNSYNRTNSDAARNNNKPSMREERKQRKKSPHYLITKQYLYSYDHEKYSSEDEKLYSKYKDIHERIDCLLFLREKDLVNLLDCFYFEQIEKNSKYTDKYFCTVEQLDDIVSLRYLLYKNRSRNNNSTASTTTTTRDHQPLKHSLIFSIMACCLESCRILHALGEPYLSLSPCNILINKRTKKVSMRPFIIDKLEFLRKYIDEPLGESHIDPYTVNFTENKNKVVVKEFFENQIWYSPPEFVFRLCSDIDIYKVTKHKKKVYKELKYQFTNSLEVDIWAAGCIFAEMLLPYPLFSAKTLEDQVTNTISVLGYGSSDNRSADTTPKYVLENRLFTALSRRNIKINKIAALKGFLTSNPTFEISGIALQTLSCMFEYNPSKRPSALTLLKIPLFHTLDSSTMYYRKLTEEEKRVEEKGHGLNPILVAYVNKVEEEQLQSHQHNNRSTIVSSAEPGRGGAADNDVTTDSIYEESIMFAALLNDKSKKRESPPPPPEKVLVESREKDLHHKKGGENLVNYLSDNETKNTSSFVALTYAFGKLEKVYRQQLTQIGKDIREMKEAIGDLKQNSTLYSEKKSNSTSNSPKLSTTTTATTTRETTIQPKPFNFNGDIRITIERIHDIEFEGKLMFSILMGRVEKIMEQELLSKNFATITIGRDISKFNYELTFQIHDIVNKRASLVGEACIDLSPLSYSSDICGWYNLYDSYREERTGQILIRITPQQPSHSIRSSTTAGFEDYPSEIIPPHQHQQQKKPNKILEDVARVEYHEPPPPPINYTIVPQQPILEEDYHHHCYNSGITSPEKRREYEKLFETSFSEDDFQKITATTSPTSPETFVFSHSSHASDSLFDDEDDLDKKRTFSQMINKKDSPLLLHQQQYAPLLEESLPPPLTRHEDPATMVVDRFLNSIDILTPSEINDEPIQRLSDHVNKTPESIELESSAQHADGEFNNIIDSLRRLQTELKSFSVL